MAIKFFSGFEPGDASEWTSTASPASQSYSTTPLQGIGGFAGVADSTGNTAWNKGGLSSATIATRFYFKTNIVTSDVADRVRTIQQMLDSTLTIAIMRIQLVVGANSSGTLKLRLLDQITSTQVGSDFTISPNTEYLIESKIVVSATAGVLELKVNGTVVATGSSLNTGTNNVDDVSVGTSQPAGGCTGTGTFDHVIVSDGAYIGPGYSIARQLVAGTPTYDAWTKNGAATAALCWSETPFSAAKNCSNLGLGNAQTALVGSFNLAGSAQEGSGIISSIDTINAGKTAMIAKATVGGNLSIRRRVAGADTDTVKAITTADAYYDDGIWTPTFTNLSAGTTEIGAVDTVAGVTDTVEDMWLIVDYTQGPQGGLPRIRHPARRRGPRNRARKTASPNQLRFAPPAMVPTGKVPGHRIPKMVLRRLKQRRVRSLKAFPGPAVTLDRKPPNRGRLRRPMKAQLRRLRTRIVGAAAFTVNRGLVPNARQRRATVRTQLRRFRTRLVGFPSIPVNRGFLIRARLRRAARKQVNPTKKRGILARFAALAIKRPRVPNVHPRKQVAKRSQRIPHFASLKAAGFGIFAVLRRLRRQRRPVIQRHAAHVSRFGSLVTLARGLPPRLMRSRRSRVVKPRLFRRIQRRLHALFPSIVPSPPIGGMHARFTLILGDSAQKARLLRAGAITGTFLLASEPEFRIRTAAPAHRIGLLQAAPAQNIRVVVAA